jgi:hypothetical protein
MANELSKPYLATLYANVENLNYYLALYNNLLLQINDKYNNIEPAKLLSKVDLQEKQTLIQILNAIRQNSIIIYVKISSIRVTVKDFCGEAEYANIQIGHNAITTTVVPNYTTVQEYTININSLFISGVGAEIARGGQEYYSNLSGINSGGYQNATTQESE